MIFGDHIDHVYCEHCSRLVRDDSLLIQKSILTKSGRVPVSETAAEDDRKMARRMWRCELKRYHGDMELLNYVDPDYQFCEFGKVILNGEEVLGREAYKDRDPKRYARDGWLIEISPLTWNKDPKDRRFWKPSSEEGEPDAIEE